MHVCTLRSSPCEAAGPMRVSRCRESSQHSETEAGGLRVPGQSELPSETLPQNDKSRCPKRALHVGTPLPPIYSRLISFQAKAATRMISFTYLYPHHLRALFCFLLRKVTQAGLKFIILQPQPSCCWNDRFTTIPSVILPSDSHCQPWSRHTLNVFLLLLVSTPWPPMHVALVACQAFRSAHITQPSGLLMVL